MILFMLICFASRTTNPKTTNKQANKNPQPTQPVFLLKVVKGPKTQKGIIFAMIYKINE